MNSLIKINKLSLLLLIAFCLLFSSTVSADSTQQNEATINDEKFNNYYDLGQTYLDAENYQKAIKAFKQAIKIKPDDMLSPALHMLIGMMYVELGEYQNAIDAYKKTLVSHPDSARAYYNLGNLYKQIGEYQQAVDACQEVIRIQPDFADGYSLLGNVYDALEQYQKSLNAYKQAARINPEDALTHLRLAVTYSKLGKSDLALEKHNIVKKLDIDLAEKLFDGIYPLMDGSSNWRFVAGNKDVLMYFDMATIKQNANGYYNVWINSIQSNEDPFGDKRSVQYWEYDCADKRHRLLQMTGYDSNDNVTKTIAENTEWQYIPPHSIAEEGLDIVCYLGKT